MATVERIPGYCFGKRTEGEGRQVKGAQASKVRQSFCSLVILTIASLSMVGCKTTSNPLVFARPQIAASAQKMVEQKRDAIGVPAANPTTTKTIGLVSHSQTDESEAMSNVDLLTSPEEDSETNEEPDAAAEMMTSRTAIDESAMNTAAVPPLGDPNSLSLELVLNRVAECYPEIEIAIGEIESAEGKTIASWGEFDTILSGHSVSQPLGFYQTYRNGFGASQPLFNGGEVYGGYRIGDGNFEPWYGERETNEGGELKAGFSLPLLKDRVIDKRRTAIRKAQLQQDQLQANVETRLLLFERFATLAYWDWVASGRSVKIQEQLIELALTRVDAIDERIEKGDLAGIAKIDNDRFIAKRKTDLIKAKRGVDKAAIKLSLFFRDENCMPVIPRIEMLPGGFPLPGSIANDRIQTDIANALASRPELVELQAFREEANVSMLYANNLLLPKLDVKGFAGQDVGGATSSKGDKTPFELQLGVFAEVPLQRREGIGKVQVAQGKLAQIDAKCRFVADKIRAEIQDAASAVNAAADQIVQSQETVRLNEESLRLGLQLFDEGDIDLLALNIYETSVANARLELLEAQFKYFTGVAAYETISRSRAFENSGQ